jgi:hypothetical protein
MVYNLLNSPKMLKDASFKRKNPEFAAAVREIELAHQHADEMLATGRLTQEEADHFEAHLYGEFIEALPVDEFEKLMKNGGMDELQALAGYEGDHDAGDIEDTRKAIEAKIKAHALDDAWLKGRISEKYYAEQSRDIEKYHDEAMDNRLADGDYENAAVDYFMSRNDVPEHGNDLVRYLKGKYGDAPGPDTKRNSGSDKPPGHVEHNIEVFVQDHHTNNPNREDKAVDSYIADRYGSSSGGGIISHDEED